MHDSLLVFLFLSEYCSSLCLFSSVCSSLSISYFAAIQRSRARLQPASCIERRRDSHSQGPSTCATGEYRNRVSLRGPSHGLTKVLVSLRCNSIPCIMLVGPFLKRTTVILIVQDTYC